MTIDDHIIKYKKELYGEDIMILDKEYFALQKALTSVADETRRTTIEEAEKAIEKGKKQDANLEPGFVVTAEYRIGELRGSNQAIDYALTALAKLKK